jgi:hypothetical protein
MDVYKSLLEHEGKNVEPLVKCTEEVHGYLIDENITPESPGRASIWTNTNIYNELGIPAIKIGTRGRPISARNEEIDIDVIVKSSANLRADGARYLQPQPGPPAMSAGRSTTTGLADLASKIC